MSVLTSENFQGILQEQLEQIHRMSLRLQALADLDDLDAIFAEFARQRSSMANTAKRYSSRLSGLQLIELHELMIEALENQLSLVIRNFMENRLRSLAEMAEQDPLTTLLNRSAFDRKLKDEVERARRYHRQLSVALLDIDRFKAVNDRLGHPGGDGVLLRVASILQSSLRHSDGTFRYGGDEFAAICPETSGGEMEILLARIESSFKEYCETAEIEPFTGISWGVASLPADALDVCGLIRIADQRLYQRKKEHHLRLTSRGDQ